MGVLGSRKKRKRVNRTLIIYWVLSALFFVIFSLLNSFCGSLKGELISKLEIEKNLSFENEQLRTEIATITRERFLTLVAQERLGLKKAKEEDVYVVR